MNSSSWLSQLLGIGGGRLIGLSLTVAVVAALSPCLRAGEQASPAAKPASDAVKVAAAAPSAKPGVPPAQVVTIHASKMPFRDVLAKVAEQADIQVVLVADSIPNDEFSDAFENLPVEAALRRVLVGKNYLVRYAKGTPPGASRVDGLYIAPDGSGAEKPVHMQQVATHREAQPEPQIDPQAVLLEIKLQSEDAAERAEALKKYLDDPDVDYDEVAKSLRDPDAKVREIALRSMENAEKFPSNETAAVATNDKNPELRMTALRILVEKLGGGAGGAIKDALADPDPAVQANAQELAQLAEQIDAFREKQREARLADQAAQAGQNPK